MSIQAVVAEDGSLEEKAPETLVEAPESVEIPVQLSKMSVDDLRAEIERREAAEAVTVNQQPTPPTGSAPQGFKWVYNRLKTPFEWQYNSITYRVEGFSFGLFPDIVANHGRRHSILLLDPIMQTAVYQLALDDEKAYGKPLKMKRRLELLDRTTQDSLTPFGPKAGERTHAAALELNDVKALLSRRIDNYVELE